MSAGSPNWARLRAIGKLPKDQEWRFPDLAKNKKLEEENKELRQQAGVEEDPVEEALPVEDEQAEAPQEETPEEPEAPVEVDEEEVANTLAVDESNTRKELDAAAEAAGVENPGKLPNKQAVLDAIKAKYE